MLKLKELSAYLDVLLPENGLNDFCPNGLQVEGKQEIKSIATAVSASLETIETAVSLGVDALIVHHGLFWSRESYVLKGVKCRKIQILLQHGISLFAYHLPLDMHPKIGNNWRAAKELGWFDLQPFGFFNGLPIGVKGKISSSHRDVFGKELEIYYKHPAISVYGGAEYIETVALVSGGAHKTIIEAAQEGVDAFITGSFDEPTWHQALEEKINFYALGHSATERIGPIALAKELEQTLHMSCHFIDIANPF